MNKDPRPFIRLHEGMPGHPKIEPLSVAAKWLLIECWCYCSVNLTDGKITSAAWGKRGSAKARQELLDAGLADNMAGGVLMHDYTDHQRSKAEILSAREAHTEANSRGGQLGAHNRWHRDTGVIAPNCSFCPAIDQAMSPTHAPPIDGSLSPRLVAVNGQSMVDDNKSRGEEEVEKKKFKPLAPTSSPRDVDQASKTDDQLIWDALIVACKIKADEVTKSGRGRLNAAVKQLRDVGATADQVSIKAGRYRAKYPNAACTPTALANNWGSLPMATEPARVLNGW